MVAESANGITIVHVLLMMAVIAFLYMLPRWRKRWESPESDRGGIAEVRERAEVQAKMRSVADRALVELLETSREISAQIDTKIRILNKLVRDADVQASRLERLLGAIKHDEGEGKTSKGEGSSSAGNDTLSRSNFVSVSSLSTLSPSSQQKADLPKKEGCIASNGGPQDPGAGISSQEERPPSVATAISSAPISPLSGGEIQELHQRIATLRAEGREPAEIARMLHISTAEVTLALHLLAEKGRRTVA